MVKIIIDNEYAMSIVADGYWDTNEIELALSDYGFDGEYHISGGNSERLFAHNPHRYNDTITITEDNIRRGMWLKCSNCGQEIDESEVQHDTCPHCGYGGDLE